MNQHDIEPDRTALKSEFSTDPSDHNAERIEYLHEGGRKDFLKELREARERGEQIDLTNIPLVQLRTDGEVVAVVCLVDGENGPRPNNQ